MTTYFAECTTISSRIEAILPGSKVISFRIPNARCLGEADFSDSTEHAYEQIFEIARNEDRNHIIRMWNFIPGIHDSMDCGRDRYMAFNAGRFRAMQKWFGDHDRVLQSAPAATGVGWSGDDLIIHAVAYHSPGRLFQNPVQIPSVQYSSRYGPQPPSFARATAINNLLLISGTASISGEESQHIGNLRLQWDLSIEHICRLIRIWSERHEIEPIVSISEVRIYLPDQSVTDQVNRLAEQTFKIGTNVEIVRADLCRRELMVEIEVIADETR